MVKKIKSKKKTDTSAIISVSIAALLAAFGQVLYKLAITKSHDDLLLVIQSPLLYAGLFVYGISAFLMITSLRKGELSTIFPFMSSTFIWVSILSKVILKEAFPPLRWAGVFVIFAGLIILGFGGGK